jgi:hypothetical protein
LLFDVSVKIYKILDEINIVLTFLEYFRRSLTIVFLIFHILFLDLIRIGESSTYKIK